MALNLGRRGIARLLLLALVVFRGGALGSADTLLPPRGTSKRAARPLADRPSVAAATAALAGFMRDEGSIVIIEHDGSNYDWKKADATPNYDARSPVARRFYETHGDYYDLLVVFTNFEFDSGPALAFHAFVSNDVKGIGKPVGSVAADFGSAGRLKGYIDMAAVTRWRNSGRSLKPGTPGFLTTLGVLAHEVGHQWLANPRYLPAPGAPASPDLLRSDAHWSYLLDSDASFMYGADWSPLPGGSYRATRVQEIYSSLDLYLMGFLDPQRVAPFTLLRNPAVSPDTRNQVGNEVQALAETVAIEQVMAAEGPRLPDANGSQKEFRLGFVFLTAPGTEPSAEDLAGVEAVRQAFAGQFFAHTRGIAVADTTLAEAPSAPHSAAPNLERAAAWLLARQAVDGSWADAPQTAIRDTAASTLALSRVLPGALPLQMALGWLRAQQPYSVDFLTRRALGLSAFALTPADRKALASVVLSLQNADGGFGAGPDLSSDALDTALALRALKALGLPASSEVSRGLAALGDMRVNGGGWPAVPGARVSTIVTAEVLLALQEGRGAPGVSDLVSGGLVALLARRNPDGGFGESPSTPFATARALQALLHSGAPADVTAAAIAWLQAQQLDDGSWNGSPFETALVLEALGEGLGPNLVVPQDRLSVSNPAPDEGEVVHVTGRVRNVGRAAAGPSSVALFDGDPGKGAPLAEATLGGLAPGQDTEFTLDFATVDRRGLHTLFARADSRDQVAESREDDNVSSRTIEVVGPKPNLVVTAGEIVASPAFPEAGEAVAVAVTVHNAGEWPAGASTLQLVAGGLGKAVVLLGQAAVPALVPGHSVTVPFQWDTTGRDGDNVLIATADSGFAIDESDEFDNEARLPVRVDPAGPAGPELELASVTLVPSRLRTLPVVVEAKVTVRNLGHSTADSTVILRDVEAPDVVLGDQALSLGRRGSTTLSFFIPVTTGGTRRFEAVANPDRTLVEDRYDNNAATAVLFDPVDTIDLEITPADVAAAPTDLVVGDPLTVAVTVRNHGTAGVTEVPLQLARRVSGGVVELERRTIEVPAGGTTVSSLTWTTTVTGDPLELVVRVDPFNNLPELSEANNEVGFGVIVRPSTRPNLTVDSASIVFAPSPPIEGKPATITATVRNTSGAAAGPFKVRFFVGDPDHGGTAIATAPLVGLAGHTGENVAVAWSPVNTRGAQGIFVVADAQGEIDEYDETDNRAFRAFRAIGLPDLVLVTADVSLDPAFPRSDQAVTIHAVVRNLGEQTSGETALAAFEGEPLVGVPVGQLTVPPIEPGGFLSLALPWNPSAPAGSRTLSLVLDPEDVVVEQDEGNNTVRRRVLVQDADLFLSEPLFSPDGDGVKDVTVLGYRASGAVTIAVSDGLGQKIRTLVENGPAEGSVTWDGSTDRGPAPDGSYVLTVTGEGGALLGRLAVGVDTNRSPIHEAAGTGRTAVGNLTCRLPGFIDGPAFMPSEDAALFIVPAAQPNFPAGLLRVALDGSYEYLAQDAWYQGSRFAENDYYHRDAVSSNGRQVLVYKDGLYVVDLVSGSRQRISDFAVASWSPDGQWIQVPQGILTPSGETFGTFSGGAPLWAWSPGSDRLALGGNIVALDGTPLASITLGQPPPENHVGTIWRRDGQIVTQWADSCEGSECESTLHAFLVDPDLQTSQELSPRATEVAGGDWSPDGSRVLLASSFYGPSSVYLADGSLGIPLSDGSLQATPLSSLAYARRTIVNDGTCVGSTPLVRNLQNLTADLQAARLPADAGLLLRGIASDRNLDHYQLDFAEAGAPEIWHPIGAASEVPVLGKTFTAWQPPGPGNYIVRLRVFDQAGHVRTRTRAVAWDRLPAFANVTQSDFLFSPNGDGVRDAVTFNYSVLAPMHMEVRIEGPQDPAHPDARPPTVRTFAFDHIAPGPQKFAWNGKDEAVQVVPDGRYTVSLNGMPFEVEVDATPPEIGWLYDQFQGAKGGPCPGVRGVADRHWHVLDPNLRSWGVRVGRSFEAGDAQVFVPQTGADGSIVLDGQGLRKVLREGGTPVNQSTVDSAVSVFGTGGATFFAEDLASNRSEIPIPGLDEQLITVGMTSPEKCELLVKPPVEPEPKVNNVRPQTIFDAGSTLRTAPPDQHIRLRYQPEAGGPWNDTAPAVDFAQLGLDLSATYRGRLVGNGITGEVASDAFLFRPCNQHLELSMELSPPEPDSKSQRVFLSVKAHSPEDPIVSAEVDVTVVDLKGHVVFSRRLQMTPIPGGFETAVTVPRLCPLRLSAEAKARGASGAVYGHDGACRKLVRKVLCDSWLEIGQGRAACGQADPDRVQVGVRAFANERFRLDIEAGPEGAPIPVATFLEDGGSDFTTSLGVDVTGRTEGSIPLRGRITLLDSGREGDKAEIQAIIDRTPPVFSVVQPPENGQLCVSQDGLGAGALFFGRAVDASFPVYVNGDLRGGGGVPRKMEANLKTSAVTPLPFTAAGLPEGDYTAHFEACDYWGNVSPLDRHFRLTRQPAELLPPTVSRLVFSPNGDGQADDTTVTVKTTEAVSLTAIVRQGSPAGPAVRTLLVEQPYSAGALASVRWDGKTDAAAVAPDGPYFVVFSSQGGCGGGTSVSATVEVDDTPPTAVLTSPGSLAPVSGSLKVIGTADDLHFVSYALAFGAGDAPSTWTTLATRSSPVIGASLGRWDTPGTAGHYTLRLIARDQAENTNEAVVTVEVKPGDFLQHIGATPSIFSPNGDGKRETTTIEYGLKAAARVRLEVRTSGGAVLRTFETGANRAAGVYAHVWDGRGDDGQPVPEGDHDVFIQASDPGGGLVTQENTVSVVVDRTPPTVLVERPIAGSFVPRGSFVRATASDLHLAEYVLTAAPETGAAVELARGNVSRTAVDLAPLAPLADGLYQLTLTATDLAENEASKLIAVNIDSTPPAVAFQNPTGGLLRGGPTPIPVTGHVTDEHLESYRLRFGAGAAPLSLVDIASGITGGVGIALGDWKVASVPDGEYTLVLDGRDKAGNVGEARATVGLDTQPPLVSISSPTEASYVTEPRDITGTASDAHLESWTLEFAPGPKETAFQWTVLATGTSNVEGASLGSWSPLPPDGPYTLRLSAKDKLEQAGTALRSAIVDTTPPAAPEPHASVLRTADPKKADVALTWKANSEVDLAGYKVFRADELLTPTLIAEPAFTDAGRGEGTSVYHVVAVDKAGLTSPRGSVKVRVDLTPPAVAFLSPAEGDSVMGSVDVRGTAYSPDDFKEYRLYVGAGTSPTTFTLLRTSSLPVAAGLLGEWLAFVEGPYTLALEAEDTTGNKARVTRAVVVDTQPPAAPVLTAVATSSTVHDQLTPTWLASVSSDVLGYLVYRNGSLANAPGLVLGDLRPYLVPGTSYLDSSLPDGQHCYRIVASDRAGNLSPPSNEICRSLDNRPPHAVIVRPPYNTRFGFPLEILAITPDLDVAAVQFEIRREGQIPWQALGAPASTVSYTTMLDPAPLVPGPYELRARAYDLAGHVDPAPDSIRVVYGDVTPPQPPTGLKAKVDGQSVLLGWNANTEPDLAGYRLYRDGTVVAYFLVAPAYADENVGRGPYEYTVTAVDTDGNESGHSAPVPALVYRIDLDVPDFPVVVDTATAVTGSGAQPNTTVAILREDTSIAAATAAASRFRALGVPLQPDGNRLSARGLDALGNRSMPASPIVVIANTPPAAVTRLASDVVGHDVTLSWDASPEADVVGYAVRRADQLLTGSKPQSDIASVEADQGEAQLAVDQVIGTSWQPQSTPATLTATFPAEVPVERVYLVFDPGAQAVSRYAVFALWQGEWVHIAGASANESYVVEHKLPSAFTTSGLRITLESPGALAELLVYKRALVPAGAPSFADGGVKDGLHHYAVTAVDRYGAESPASALDAPVGDATAPSKPTGLVASVAGRDVHLTWNPNPEPDLAGYVVFRDSERLARVPGPSALDPGRPNGTYVYTVLAVDEAGNESPESDPAPAIVAVVPAPPAAPVITYPADAAHPAVLDRTITDVAGRADPGSIVALEVNGEARGFAAAEAGLVPDRLRPVPSASAYGLSLDGQKVGYSTGDGIIGILDLASGGTTTYPAAGPVAALRFSAGADRVAYRTVDGGLRHLELGSGEETQLADLVSGYDWSPSGLEIAFTRGDGSQNSLAVVTPATGLVTVLSSSTSTRFTAPRFAPDGTRLAFLASVLGATAELRLFDLSLGRESVVDTSVGGEAPSWSPDGQLLAYGTGGKPGKVRVRSVETGALVRELSSDQGDAQRPAIAPDGERLAFEDNGPLGPRVLVAGLAGGAPVSTRVAEPRLVQWTTGRVAVVEGDRLFFLAPTDGAFRFEGVALSPGQNTVVARARDAESGLESPDSETVLVTVPAESFPDLAVLAVEQAAFPASPVLGQPAQLLLRVRSAGALGAPESDLRAILTDTTGATILDQVAHLQPIEAGAAVTVVVPWTPAAASSYHLVVSVDDGGTVVESDETNNRAERDLVVTASGALLARLEADAASYPAQAPVSLTVRILDGGAAATGTAVTTVEDGSGTVVATLDSRPFDVGFGQATLYKVPWNTGTTYAGNYVFRVRLRNGGPDLARAEQPFAITADLKASARLTPNPTTVSLGQPARLTARVENRTLNASLVALARMRLRPAGGGAVVFETQHSVPSLVPGAAYESDEIWPAATPAGAYRAEIEVLHDGATLATAQATLTVTAATGKVVGSLMVDPAEVLQGQPTNAQVHLTNTGTAAATGYPASVEVVNAAGGVLVQASATVDLPAGASQSVSLTLPTAGLFPARYAVRLRGGAPKASLDRTQLTVHGVIAPPSIDSPPDGATVATAHPTLRVNNASSPEGAPLVYEFELYPNAELSVLLLRASGIAEAPLRTFWFMKTPLGEDQTFYWRARASDGFSQSAWSAVARFKVDALNLPPSPPVPQWPVPDSHVAPTQPRLVVRNGIDPEGAPLTYEFQIAATPEPSAALASAAGLSEGLLQTSWLVPVVLEHGATYYWRARVNDGVQISTWSEPAAFTVDITNLPPGPPVPLSPTGGVRVGVSTPALVARSATDPESDPLTYRFELDRVPTFDSPALQASGDIEEGILDTRFTGPSPLQENATYYWRVAASDGANLGPWATASFVVNAVNEAPGVPVLLDPVGRTVATATPALTLRNTTDPDGDSLLYELEVRDPSGSVVATVAGVVPGAFETSWTVTPPLGEDHDFLWRARASDGELLGGWSAPAPFRVNAILEPPTAPLPLAPAEDSTLITRHPTLVVANATSPEALALTYTFELYSQAADGSLTLLDSVSGVPEELTTTSWIPSAELPDGSYAWRARAHDGHQVGPWSATAHLKVLVDAPPSAPQGLRATPGDRRVTLNWNPNLEPDVTGYRVYRSLTSTGPYDFISSAPLPHFDDMGLTNGVTVYYVVTATDAHLESPPSREAAATPQGPPPSLVAEVQVRPQSLGVECLSDDDDDDDDDDHHEHRAARGTAGTQGAPEAHVAQESSTGLLRPTLECVEKRGNAGFTAYFGYQNDNDSSLSVPVGSNNKFSPSPQGRGQATSFAAGRTPKDRPAFSVDFASGSLAWATKGQTATASSSSARCSTPPPAVSGCPEWITVTAELPAGVSPSSIAPASVRLLGALLPDPSYHPIVDRDGDSISEMEFRVRLKDLRPYLHLGANTLGLTGLAGGVPFQGSATLTVFPLVANLRVTPRTLSLKSKGDDIRAHLSFPREIEAEHVTVSTVRLNDKVPVKSVVSRDDNEIVLRFDGKAVQTVLAAGSSVEIRITGKVGSLAFTAIDAINVTP